MQKCLKQKKFVKMWGDCPESFNMVTLLEKKLSHPSVLPSKIVTASHSALQVESMREHTSFRDKWDI